MNGKLSVPNAQQELRFPEASVVVVTRDRAFSLERTLSALQQLQYPAYEIVVVDNGSRDATREIAGRYNTHYVFSPSENGIGASRQIGVQSSRGEVIAFCDDDCVPSPHWLSALARRLMSDQNLGLVGGQVINVGFPGNKKYKGRSILGKHGKLRFIADQDKAEFFGNMNLAFRRDVINAVGGYDPFFNVLEEIDLAVRIQKLGFGIVYEPDAVLEHHYTGVSYKRRQFFFGPELVRLYFCMKHDPPRSFGRWVLFVGYELRLLVKEMFALVKKFMFSLRKKQFGHLLPCLVEGFNKVSARVAIPWLLLRARRSDSPGAGTSSQPKIAEIH